MRFFVRFLEIVALILGLGSGMLAISLFASLTGETPLWLGFVSGIEQFLVQQLPKEISALSPFIRAVILSVVASVLLGLVAYWHTYYSHLRVQAKKQRQERKKMRQQRSKHKQQKQPDRPSKQHEPHQESGSAATSAATPTTSESITKSVEPTSQQTQQIVRYTD